MKSGLSMFELLCYAEKLPTPTPEFAFANTIGRKWRFDWAFIPQRVAVEQDGSIWTQGRHTRGAGYLKDIEKLNTATAMGWKVFRTTPSTLHLLTPFLREALKCPHREGHGAGSVIT